MKSWGPGCKCPWNVRSDFQHHHPSHLTMLWICLPSNILYSIKVDTLDPYPHPCPGVHEFILPSSLFLPSISFSKALSFLPSNLSRLKLRFTETCLFCRVWIVRHSSLNLHTNYLHTITCVARERLIITPHSSLVSPTPETPGFIIQNGRYLIPKHDGLPKPSCFAPT